jgi:molecular chaperone DnaK (HSP70)
MQYSPLASEAEGYSIALPGFPNDENLGIRRNRLRIKAADLRQIFEPTINQIIDLVREQIRATNKTTKAILLVGGFGQNTYLKESLRNTFGDAIRVLQPVNAWTAVVRGAVMMGLTHCNSQLAQITLVSRRARKHYGLQLSTEFNPNIHDIRQRYAFTFARKNLES